MIFHQNKIEGERLFNLRYKKFGCLLTSVKATPYALLLFLFSRSQLSYFYYLNYYTFFFTEKFIYSSHFLYVSSEVKSLYLVLLKFVPLLHFTSAFTFPKPLLCLFCHKVLVIASMNTLTLGAIQCW